MFENLFTKIASARRQRRAPCDQLVEIIEQLELKRAMLESELALDARPAKRRHVRYSLEVVRLQYRKAVALQAKMQQEQDCD
ncbi:MAG: hypothetical protein KDI82_05045 [Gammaproteobacteria bacterium]|nr:hypothetical protein [Gammaproteobacteria bacterium]